MIRRALSAIGDALFPPVAAANLPDVNGFTLTEYGQAADRIRDCRSDRPVLFDQESPVASEVEAWLAGGAR